MRRFIKSRVILTTAAGLMSYWAWEWMLPSQLAFTLISALAISVWCGLIVTHGEAAWTAVRKPSEMPLFVRVSLVGTAGLGFSIIALFSWTYAYQYLDQPMWMVRHPLRNWINWWFFWFSLMLLVASRVMSDRGFLPDGAAKGSAIIVAIAVFIMLVIFYTIGNL